jgi:hypothetical protein
MSESITLDKLAEETAKLITAEVGGTDGDALECGYNIVRVVGGLLAEELRRVSRSAPSAGVTMAAHVVERITGS